LGKKKSEEKEDFEACNVKTKRWEKDGQQKIKFGRTPGRVNQQTDVQLNPEKVVEKKGNAAIQ